METCRERLIVSILKKLGAGFSTEFYPKYQDLVVLGSH